MGSSSDKLKNLLRTIFTRDSEHLQNIYKKYKNEKKIILEIIL